ncbi:MAG: hypothetical protein SF053_19235 [Bacteroidia bacterium]|nr:hypothetical protein [Bacteroidia bacterium]
MPDTPVITVQQTQVYAGHRGAVFAMATAPDARWLYTAGDDGIVAGWDLHASHDLGTALLQAGCAVYSLVSVPGHNWLAAGLSDGTLQLVDLTSRQLVATWRRADQAVYGLHYDAATDLLWILYARGGLSVYSLARQQEIAYLQVCQDHLRALCAPPGVPYWYIGASDGYIYTLDPLQMTVRSRHAAHTSSVFSLMWMPDPARLLSGGRDAQIQVWDPTGPDTPLETIPAHLYTVNAMALHPVSPVWASASRDKTLKLWHTRSMALLKVIDAPRHNGHKHSVNKIAWLAQDFSLISCSDDRKVIRWSVNLDEIS